MARDMRAAGCGWERIGKALGLHYKSVKAWLDPICRDKAVERLRKWKESHPDKVKEINRRCYAAWYARLGRAGKDRENAKYRQRYANNPGYKERDLEYKRKCVKTPQGRIRRKITMMTRRYLPGNKSEYVGFMKLATGMSRAEFGAKFFGPGVFDHIVPVSAFDLTNPEHLVRCCYAGNLRKTTKWENESKGSTVTPGLDIMSLPWVGTEEALEAAKTFIKRQLDALEKLNVHHAA